MSLLPISYFHSKYPPYYISNGDGSLPDGDDLSPFERAKMNIAKPIHE